MAYPEPTEVAPWYLRNITQALALDSASGNVYVRTNSTIVGNVSVGNVAIGSLGNVDLSNTYLTTSVVGNVTVLQGTSPWTVSGNVGITGNASISGNVGIIGNIAGITANVTVVDGGGSLTVDGNVNANITGGNVTTTFSTAALDAFGRLRVSNPYTLFDSALNGERRYDFSSSTAGSGNVTYDYNANVRQLNVTSSNGDEVIRESMNVFPYQPGKSLLTMNSFVMSPAKANLRQRVGFFTTNNGVYFEQNGSSKIMVIRSYSSGAITEERVAQSSWNGDKLNGTGPSGKTLDLSAPQIYWNDIEWLGVGSVRTGFIIDGQFITCHTFNHANDSAFTTTYMSTATLPVRYEITNTGATTGSSTFQQICSTVISEGGYNNAYFTYTAGTDITTKRLVTATTYYPVASIRLQSGYLNSIVRLSQVDILSPTVNYYRWQILKNATLTGATWASSSSTTRTQVDTAATAVSGGTAIQSGYVSSRELAEIIESFYGQLGRTLAGVSDTLTLAIAATNNNADVLAQIGWQEIL